MDIQRQIPATPWYKKYSVGLVIGAIALSGIGYAVLPERTAYSANASNLAIGEVRQGDFSVTVRGTGILRPRQIRWLAANVSGRVDAIHAKPGAEVEAGDLIIEMSNPELLQRAEETLWELEALGAENEALRVSLESQVLDQEARVLNAEMSYESAKINLDAQELLLQEGNSTVSRIEHQRSQLETKQFLANWDIEKQRLKKMLENQTAQQDASLARFKRLQNSLHRVQHQVASLKVKASIDGVVQAMPLEPGQQINIGDNIAKLAQQDELIAEIQIPERQVNGVSIGQPVVIDTRRSTASGRVSRIDPAVVNGVVQVDVVFTESIPPEARPDLTVDGTISISSLPQALYVGRPTFAQNDTTTSVYLVTDNGRFAERVPVKFGIGSASEIQIVDGLSPGQRIILSDSSAWDHLDRISIQ